ncbi:MAG: FliM/FliN family flagellar motor switch protein [Natronohydrobacter sp.]|nr:FliM/FliN family flagellar motor switch protein [Natronohydrobacter sp.]
MTQTEQSAEETEPARDDARVDALRQMATRHQRAAAQDRAQLGACLRVAFGRMAADCPGLDAVVQKVDIRQGALAEVLDLMESGVFLALLEGQGDGIGLLTACPMLMAGMIEAQTTGRVDTAMPARRKPTRTDAALIAPLIDAFLRQIDLRCADLPQADMVTGYVYGSYLDDPRPLGIVLDDGMYHILHLRISLGFGAKEGDVFLILPDTPAQTPKGKDAAPDINAERDWQARIETAISSSEVVLNAMLGRVRITLTDALRLRPGDILRLPESALETLTVETINRDAIGIGRLGQARGQRAVRLTADPGVLTDATGATAPRIALPAQITPFVPPKAAFVPDAPDRPEAGPFSGVQQS